MSDLICRKTMRVCDTPGMCSPWGGCPPVAEWSAPAAGEVEITRLRARIAELEDIVEALRIGEAVLNRALKSEVDLRNEVYTERVAIAEARADTATRALADLDQIAWLAAEEDSWFGDETDIAVQRAAAERHRAALSKTEKKG